MVEPVGAKLGIVASHSVGGGIGIERVLEQVEAVERQLGTVGVECPIRFVESALGMHLVGQVAHLHEDGFCLAIVGDGLCLAFLTEKRHAQFVEGDAQGVAVAYGTKDRNGLGECLFRIGILVQSQQHGGALGAAHSQFVAIATLLFNLAGAVGIGESLLIVAHLVIDLRGHALQNGHAGRVVYLLGQFDGFQDVLFGLLGSVGTDVYACQRVE